MKKKGFSVEEAKSRDDFDRLALERAEWFSVVRFEGRGQWTRIENIESYDEAIQIARDLGIKNARRPLIYAHSSVSGSPIAVPCDDKSGEFYTRPRPNKERSS